MFCPQSVGGLFQSLARKVVKVQCSTASNLVTVRLLADTKLVRRNAFCGSHENVHACKPRWSRDRGRRPALAPTPRSILFARLVQPRGRVCFSRRPQQPRRVSQDVEPR
jgi:hypothetical protein